MTDLLGWKLDEYIYMSQIFLYIRPLAALPCAWLIDRFGLRRTIYLALLLTLMRNSTRTLLFSAQITYWQEMKVFYWSICSLCENLIILIYYSLPLKISENWFSEQERSLAFSVVSISPTLGGAISSFVLPRIIQQQQGLHWLATGNLFALLLSILVIMVTVTRSRPKQPPSLRSFEAEQAQQQLRRRSTDQPARQFGENIKNMLTNFHLMLHILTLVTFVAMAQSVTTVVQDVLAASDLSPIFCGNLLALNAVYGSLIQMVSSRYLDSRSSAAQQQNATENEMRAGGKRRTWRMKLLMLLTCLSFLLYLSSLTVEQFWGRYQWIMVVVSSLLYGSIQCWTIPYYNDLVADLILVSPVTQATVSAGSGAIFVLLNTPYQMMFVYLRQMGSSSSPPPKYPSNRSAKAKADYSLSMLFAGLIVSAVTFLYLTCFHGPANSGDQSAAAAAAANTINNASEIANERHRGRRCCCRHSCRSPTTTTAANHR